ncbi:MAG: ABC transporter permease [Fusobacteriaceae bacterium]
METTNKNNSNIFVKLFKNKQTATIISMIILIIFFSLTSKYFLTTGNFLTIALQTSVIGIIALGMTYTIITGGIDLSVGSIVAFSGIAAGYVLKTGAPMFVGILAGLLAGTVAGLINGFLVTNGKLPPFIATLGIMMSLRGLTLAITGGMPISGFKDNFADFSGGKFLGVPHPVIYFIILGAITAYILKNTVIGKHIYAIGSNESASELSGVNVNKVKLYVYGLTGFLSAFAGVVLASRLISAQPTEGAGYELDVIAAVVIGGASLSGGVGSIVGTIIGAFIMSILRNGLNMLNVSGFWQQVAVGIVVLVAVYIDKKKATK